MNQQRQALIKDLYESIENRSIIRGQQLLTERELCDIFHVKRSLLREALVALEALGVIDIRERQGMFRSRAGRPPGGERQTAYRGPGGKNADAAPRRCEGFVSLPYR